MSGENATVLESAEYVREAIMEALARLNGLPHSRERSLVITKLEEAGLWLSIIIGGSTPVFTIMEEKNEDDSRLKSV
jgi:hypothetical protein